MIEYIRKHPEKVLGALTEHIELVLITLVISLAIACLLTLLAMRSERVSDALNNLFSVLYSVPSLALFALLIPVTGLGRTTAVIVLTLYNQYILLRSFTAGLRIHVKSSDLYLRYDRYHSLPRLLRFILGFKEKADKQT